MLAIPVLVDGTPAVQITSHMGRQHLQTITGRGVVGRRPFFLFAAYPELRERTTRPGSRVQPWNLMTGFLGWHKESYNTVVTLPHDWRKVKQFVECIGKSIPLADIPEDVLKDNGVIALHQYFCSLQKQIPSLKFGDVSASVPVDRQTQPRPTAILDPSFAELRDLLIDVRV